MPSVIRSFAETQLAPSADAPHVVSFAPHFVVYVSVSLEQIELVATDPSLNAVDAPELQRPSIEKRISQ